MTDHDFDPDHFELNGAQVREIARILAYLMLVISFYAWGRFMVAMMYMLLQY